MFVINKKNSLSPQILQAVENKLSFIIDKNHHQHKHKIQRNLYNLYNGSILFSNNDDKFSDHELTKPQKDFFNLGLTCHLFNGFNHVQ